MRLSSPIHTLRPHYSVVVIGSGYGAGIAASRLSRAGQDVCVLERGKEFDPGDFPTDNDDFLEEMQLDLAGGQHVGAHSGLYDFRLNREINVLVGCGLGGTSLINANVSLEPHPDVLADPSWPAELRADIPTRLEVGFERARAMLRPTPYPADRPSLPKTQALAESARYLGLPFRRPPINVTFQAGTNHVGVWQDACHLCGDCVSGCNHTAKNTVAMNYLPDAKNHGATIFTGVSVRHLERAEKGWRVYVDLVGSGRDRFSAPPLFVHADVVVLGAGTLGSTEILLRSKRAGLRVSGRLGERFSGNGDVLAFGYNNDREIRGVGFGEIPAWQRDPVGPCITGLLDNRDTPRVDDGMIVEEGSIPGALASVLPTAFFAASSLIGRDTDVGWKDFLREQARTVKSMVFGAYQGAVNNTQTYLVMAHDGQHGAMQLEDDHLRISWPGAGHAPAIQRANSLLKDATIPLGGTYVKDPVWTEIAHDSLVTVHPLGGCAMAEDAQRGVVDHKGRVFAGSAGKGVHEGLYVSDGAVVPRSLGVNPLLTISALAERCMMLLCEDRGWRFDTELPPRPRAKDESVPVGIRFTETMRGYFSKSVTDDFLRAEQQGLAEASPLAFTLTIQADDVRKMVEDPRHEARMLGTVVAPALSPRPLLAHSGVFHLFVPDPTLGEARRMLYRMTLESEEGRRFELSGFKVAKDDPGWDMWADLTTLYITVHEPSGTSRVVCGKGVLRISLGDFLRQLTTMEAVNAKTLAQSVEAKKCFNAYFLATVLELYGPLAQIPRAA
jgi:cholesterol oxidase